MFKRRLKKPDGRDLLLYGFEPVSEALSAPSPSSAQFSPRPELRWHPLRGEWVAYAAYRQDRVFLPPKEYNPLAPMRDGGPPTELPQGNYEMAVFENLSPSLSSHAVEPAPSVVRTARATGACEVVVFSQDPTTSLGRLPLKNIELLFEVWGDRYAELGSREDIKYVMPFENRGVEVGVTLHHPHGQLYAYPFVPPVPARELEMQKRYLDETGRGLLGSIISREIDDGRRLLYGGRDAAAFVPACARYPYEVWIAPRRAAETAADLTVGERQDLARALKTTLLKFDGLWNRPFPYLMVLHGAPTDGRPHPEAHFHIEIYPPYRTRERLKYLAGTELGAGMFANDTLPEAKAEELKQVEVTLE